MGKRQIDKYVGGVYINMVVLTFKGKKYATDHLWLNFKVTARTKHLLNW